MTGWVLNHWKRYGHDRLYAQTPGGTALGYLDMKTRELHPAEPSDLPLLTAAVASYLNPTSPVPSGRHAAGSQPAGAAATEPGAIYAGRHEVIDWDDISTNDPGTAARERAVAERGAAPIRTALSRLLGRHTEERAWRIGADGEQAVAAQLSKLGQEWRTIHAVPVGERGSDIDHVVIGPAGVFTVNAKNHPDATIWVGRNTFIVNGNRTHYIRNSRHEAARASRLLADVAGRQVHVRAIIAVLGAQHGLTIKDQPRDGTVHILPAKKITNYLLGLPRQLGPEETEALYELACRSTTWRPDRG
jgi:hypothetical protein